MIAERLHVRIESESQIFKNGSIDAKRADRTSRDTFRQRSNFAWSKVGSCTVKSSTQP